MLAIAQGFALRQYWNRAIFWGLATAAGGYSSLVALVGIYLFARLPLPLAVALGGIVLGVAQGYVLRGVSRWWAAWPLLNGLLLWLSTSWYVSAATGAAIYGSTGPWWEWPIQAMLTGLIGSPLKGLALVCVLPPVHRRPKG